jgi:hypothetical protein
MSVKNVTIVGDAALADVTTAAGTDRTFTPDSEQVVGGIHCHDAAEPDFAERQNVTFKARNPVLSRDGFSKGKRWITLKQPFTLDTGEIIQHVCRAEIEIHPDLASADVEAFVASLAQLLVSTATKDFILSGDLS